MHSNPPLSPGPAALSYRKNENKTFTTTNYKSNTACLFWQHNVASLSSEHSLGTVLEAIWILMKLHRTDAKQTEYENKLFCRSKELALQFNDHERNEQQMTKEFDSVWHTWINELVKDTPPVQDIDFWKNVSQILSENHEIADLEERKQGEFYKQVNYLDNYSDYIMLKRNADLSDQDQFSEQADASSEHKEQEYIPVKQKSNSPSSLFFMQHFQLYNPLNKTNIQVKQDVSQNNDLLPEDHTSVMVLITNVSEQTNEILERAQKQI